MRSYRVSRVADPGAPFGRVAQLAEHSTLNRQVVGSIPTASTICLVPKTAFRAVVADLTKRFPELDSGPGSLCSPYGSANPRSFPAPWPSQFGS